MPKGKPGVRISCIAVFPFSNTAYTVARMRVPASASTYPSTAKAAFDLFCRYVDINTQAHSSDLGRRLQISDSHANKVLRDCKIRKCNVLLLPNHLVGEKTMMGEFAQELEDGYDSQYEKWLLQEVEGGVHCVSEGGMRYVKTGHSGVDGAYAMIAHWLRSVMPVRHLQMWDELVIGGLE